MRESLPDLEGQRHWFGAIYRGTTADPLIAETLRSPPVNPIALLQSVFLESDLIADHVWSNWPQQFQSLPTGSKVNFLATVKPYEKKFGWDYGLEEIAWVQAVGSRESRVKHPPPQSQEEATYLLSLFNYAYRVASKQRRLRIASSDYELTEGFEGVYCSDIEVRFSQWSDRTTQDISSLALEGWANPNPRPLAYHVESSKTLLRMLDFNDRTITQCCQIASWMNGATLWQSFGEK